MISYFIKIISRSGITRNKKTVNRLVFVFKQAPKSLISNSGIRFGLMLIAIFIQSTSAYSQSQQSKNNYTGGWETATSWNPSWNPPQTVNVNSFFTIYGYISCDGSLSVDSSYNMIIQDTLVVKGNLTLGDQYNMTINEGGILIVLGDLIIGNKSDLIINNSSYLVVIGSFVKNGSLGQGSLISNAIPSNLFIGNSITPGLDPGQFPVFNCPGSSPYTYSGCSNGNLIDLSEEPLYDFYQSLVYDPPVIDQQPGDTSTCITLGVDFSVNATEVDIYTWQLDDGAGFQNLSNGIEYSGVNSTELTIDNPSTLYDGYLYRCSVLGLDGSTIYSDPALLTVFDQPAANAGLGGDACDLNFDLNATASIGIGTWSKTSGSGDAVFSPNANDPSATVTVDAYDTYSFTWTEENGTCSDSDLITVNFYQQPSANAGLGGDACDLDFDLNATANIGTGTWSKTSGSGDAVFSPNANDPSATVTVDAYDTYSFTWTEENGTCSDSDLITINFNQQPSANAGLGGDACDLDFDLNATASIGIGTWSKTSGSGDAVFSPSANDPAATVTVDAYDTHSFTWTEGIGTCAVNASIVVNFYEPPVVIAGTDAQVCGTEYQLVASQTIGNGMWSTISGPGEVEFIDEVVSQEVAVTVSDLGIYVFKWTGQNEICSDNSIVEIEFSEVPQTFAGVDQELFGVSETTMLASLENGETGDWIIVSGSANIVDESSPTSDVLDLGEGENIFRWMVSRGICQNFSEVRILVRDILTPTVITPNGDHKNDYFVIQGIGDLGPVNLHIFDRWGKELYSNSHYNNEWSGIDKNGHELEEGTYFYIIEFNNKEVIKSYVLIKR